MSHDVMPGTGFALKGWMVLAILLGFFGVIASVNAVMIHYAISTFRGEQEASPYEHGLAYDKDIEAAREQEALHWKVSVGVSRDEGGEARVEVSIKDASQTPVIGLVLTSALDSPIDKKLDKTLSLAETAPGVYSGRITADPGQWDLLLDARRETRLVFRSKNRIALR
ncbi:MAG TPA: FixH family protein [Methylocella sp.]|nr:FixH family protein [Methylocella sp.]